MGLEQTRNQAGLERPALLWKQDTIRYHQFPCSFAKVQRLVLYRGDIRDASPADRVPIAYTNTEMYLRSPFTAGWRWSDEQEATHSARCQYSSRISCLCSSTSILYVDILWVCYLLSFDLFTILLSLHVLLIQCWKQG